MKHPLPPPPPTLSFSNTTAESIHLQAKSIRSIFLQSIAAIKRCSNPENAKRSPLGAFQFLSMALGHASAASAAITLPSMVHADADIRKASNQWKNEFKGMFDEALSDRELYDILVKWQTVDNKNVRGADDEDEDIRFQRNILKILHRNGCSLESTFSRTAIQQKRRKIEETCTAFCAAINDCNETLLFTREELNGVEGISRFPRDDSTGKYVITLKAPDTLPILKFATNPRTRQLVNEALSKKCQDENTPRFLDVLKLRHECATLLGYQSHGHYMCETKMVETPKKAEEFLLELLEAYRPKCLEELDLLLDMKRKDFADSVGNAKNEDDLKLDPWDVSYYTQLYKSKYAGIDEAALREFFPLEHVKSTILSIYEELLGLRFERLTDAEVWHEDVECYAVRSATCSSNQAGNDGELFGHFFFDIYPRKGKYSHQCVYPLRPSYVFDTTSTTDDGSSQRVLPASVNIGNLTPTLEKNNPSLLLFREVETFFHECGHIFHCILTKSRHSLHSWAWSAVPWPGGVEQDFLEVPSMMLENFVWRPEILRRLSKHVSDDRCLSDETIDALSKSRFLMTGYSRCKYLAMALYDLKVHSGNGPEYEFDGKMYDAVKLYNVMIEKYTGIAPTTGSFAAASWFHLMMGYDAGYYGYIYSETYAADLFSQFEELSSEDKSVIDCNFGRKYREMILSPGATLDGATMLRNFLGRDASKDAFTRRILTA